MVSRFPKHTANLDARTGAFRIGQLLANTYRLRLQAPGFVSRVLEYSLGEGGVWGIDTVTLQRAGWIAVASAAIPPELRSVVEILVRDGAGAAVARIDSVGGAARTVPIAPGDYSLEVVGAGVAHVCLPVRVRAGAGTTVAPPVQRGTRSQLRVVLPPGMGREPRVHLKVHGGSGTAVDRLLPGAIGLVRTFDCALAPGAYEVTVRIGDAAPTQAKIEVPIAGPGRFTIRVRPQEKSR